MFAARIASPKKYEINDIEIPVINDGQCLIKLEQWSVCGSDIRHAYGPVHPEEEYPMRHGGACHECAGTIVESKSDKFKVGQRVIVLPGQDGPGGLVEYYPGDEGRMALVPDHGDLGEWLMCQPSGTVLYSCQQMGTILGKDVVVMGQGSIGLSFTAIVARAGARRVIAVDPLDYRLEWGKKFGATHTINPDKDDVDEALAEITDGKLADISVEASGFPDALSAAIRSATKHGKVIIFGIQAGPMGRKTEIDTSIFLKNAPTIIPTSGAGSGDPIGHIDRMIELKERGWWDPGQMKTHEMKFDNVQEAYDQYEQYEDNVVKVLMSND
jgi:L-iditol 2-dehydrogenase